MKTVKGLITCQGVVSHSYIAEGVCPVAGGVDVAGRGGAVGLHGRRVRDDGGLAGVTRAQTHSRHCRDRWVGDRRFRHQGFRESFIFFMMCGLMVYHVYFSWICV